MKEKMLKVKDYVIAHKKQIIIGVGVAALAIIGGKTIVKKLKAVEVYDDEIEEITNGTIEEVSE